MKNLYACFLAHSRCNRHTFIWGIMRFCPCCIFFPPSSVEYLHKCVYNHYLNAIKTHFSGKLDTAKSLKPFAALFIYSFQFWHCMYFSFISYTQSAINWVNEAYSVPAYPAKLVRQSQGLSHSSAESDKKIRASWIDLGSWPLLLLGQLAGGELIKHSWRWRWSALLGYVCVCISYLKNSARPGVW